MTECDAGRGTAWTASGAWESCLPSLGDSLFVLHLLQEPEESCVLGPLHNGAVMARMGDERWRNCVPMISRIIC